MSKAAAGAAPTSAIAIRLHSGRKIRSPVLVGKDQTRAVQAEITRRLRLDRSGGIGRTPVPRAAPIQSASGVIGRRWFGRDFSKNC